MRKIRKIKVVIPNAGMSRATLDERAKMLSRYLDPTTGVVVDCIESGPATIESQTDEVLAEPFILRQAVAAEREGFDACVVYCFSDPGLGACRELISIPVVGPGESALSIAVTLGHRFGVITTRPDNVLRTRIRIEKSLYGGMLCSVRSMGIDVASLREDEDATRRSLREACKASVELDGAKVVVLGCLGMADYGRDIARELGVPVIDPAFIAMAKAETMIKLGIAHGGRGLPIVNESTRRLLISSEA